MPLIPKPPKPMNLPSLLNWMLLGTALLGAWWACYCLALRPGRSFGYNRAFLGLGPLLAAAAAGAAAAGRRAGPPVVAHAGPAPHGGRGLHAHRNARPAAHQLLRPGHLLG